LQIKDGGAGGVTEFPLVGAPSVEVALGPKWGDSPAISSGRVADRPRAGGRWRSGWPGSAPCYGRAGCRQRGNSCGSARRASSRVPTRCCLWARAERAECHGVKLRVQRSETNLCHFRRAWLLRSRSVIGPLPSSRRQATLPTRRQDALHISAHYRSMAAGRSR
jgi:hypothetical protein